MSRWKDQREEEKEKEAKKQESPTLEDFEDGMESDMERLHQAFRDRAAREQRRVLDVCDSNYYFVVCFSNREQLDEFCASIGLNADEIYMDGRDFAKKINRALKTPDTIFPKIQPFNRDYVRRAREKGNE